MEPPARARAAYRISQIIHDFASKIVFLVPECAVSGGTLTCLSANEIRLGAYATLGPIDITIDDIELASIEYFKRFATDCCESIVQMLRKYGGGITQVESELLVEMVKQVTAIKIGSFYRESDLTGHYAKRLMLDYMFSDLPNKTVLSNDITERLLRGFPSHDFALDFHMCKELNLPAIEMSEDESDLTKKVISLIDQLVKLGIVCRDIGTSRDRNYKAPFIRLYDVPQGDENRESS